ANHHLTQTRVHLAGCPEIRLDVLHPLEVGDHHAAGVDQDVRQDQHAAVVEHEISIRVHWSVGALGDDTGANLVCVVAGDLRFERSRGAQVEVQGKELVV